MQHQLHNADESWLISPESLLKLTCALCALCVLMLQNVGSTLSYYSDTQTSPANSFQAGVWSDPPPQNTSKVEISPPQQFTVAGSTDPPTDVSTTTVETSSTSDTSNTTEGSSTLPDTIPPPDTASSTPSDVQWSIESASSTPTNSQ